MVLPAWEEKKHSLSFGPISFQSPAVVEVVRFPSGSKTLGKDTVGEHGQHLNPFTAIIYINTVFDVNASPVVLIFNIVGMRTAKPCDFTLKAGRLWSCQIMLTFKPSNYGVGLFQKQ